MYKENMFRIEQLQPGDTLDLAEWDIRGPIKGVGKYKKKLKKYLEGEFPYDFDEEGQYRSNYEFGHLLKVEGEETSPLELTVMLSSEGFSKHVYLQSYLQFLQELEWPAVLLTSQARDVFEWEPRDTRSALDPLFQDGSRTHLQDIAVRYAISQMGLQWNEGGELLCINRYDIEGSEGDSLPEDTDALLEMLYVSDPEEVREYVKDIARVIRGELWWSILNPGVVPGLSNIKPYPSNETPINEKLGMREFQDDWYRKTDLFTVEELFQDSRYLLTRKRNSV